MNETSPRCTFFPRLLTGSIAVVKHITERDNWLTVTLVYFIQFYKTKKFFSTMVERLDKPMLSSHSTSQSSRTRPKSLRAGGKLWQSETKLTQNLGYFSTWYNSRLVLSIFPVTICFVSLVSIINPKSGRELHFHLAGY